MQRLKAFKKQVDVTITWYMKNKMKDKDNERVEIRLKEISK